MAEKRNYRWRDENFYARVNNEIANRVSAYQEKYNALQSDYQKRNAGRKYTYEDACVRKIYEDCIECLCVPTI